MQLYKVNFRSQRGDVVETGTFLVCASNKDDAQSMLAAAVNLPPSQTSFETSRVKPSIYELQRSEFRLSDVAAFLGDDREAGAVHEVRVAAKVFGYSESSVLRRLAGAVVDHSSASRSALPKHINELSIEIERADQRPRASRVEEQSIYKERRMFAGGAARPR